MRFEFITRRETFTWRIESDSHLELLSDIVAVIRLCDRSTRLSIPAGTTFTFRGKLPTRAQMLYKHLRATGSTPCHADQVYIAAREIDTGRTLILGSIWRSFIGLLRYQWRYGKKYESTEPNPVS